MTSSARRHDYAFFQWAVTGFLLAFGVITGFSIGLPFLVLGLVAFGVMCGREQRWPGALGSLSGVGIVAVVIGLVGEVTAPAAWAGVGTGMSVCGASGFWWLRCRPGLDV